MTLPSHDYRDKFPGTRRRVLSAGDSVVARDTAADSIERLRRRALAQYSRLVFSVLDDLRAAGSCVGARSPRNFQGLRNSRRIARALRRHAGDWLCRHVRDVADMAVLSKGL
jgi:hypothetical protein